MKFQDLKPGELFTFKPVFGGPWHDKNLYRKATDCTYHRADKVLMIRAIADRSLGVAPESSDAVQPLPSRGREGSAASLARQIGAM